MIFRLSSSFRRPVFGSSLVTLTHVFPRGIKHLHSISDTIYAISSGPVTKSGVSVIRASGPGAKFCLDSLLMNTNCEVLARRASLRNLYCPKSKEKLDKALILWFPGPHSFTGEDVAELHLHGSHAVVSGVLNSFEILNSAIISHQNRAMKLNIGPIRPAAPGEFTRRAFENGKMDLTEVEGLSDLLDAQTELQRVQAISQMEGHLRLKFEYWRSEIVHCLAHMEAVIDFGDDDREGDISEHVYSPLIPRLDRLLADLDNHLQDGHRGEIVREGLRIVLTGPPNAGKSSVLNLMARRPAAIVSPYPGTTRDVIEVKLNYGGVCCILTDTAGIRPVDNSVDAIEVEGMKRARNALGSADIRIFVCDSDDIKSQNAVKDMITSSLGENKFVSSNIIVLFNKIDMLASTADRGSLSFDLNISHSNVRYHQISCVTGEGLNELEKYLIQSVHDIIYGTDNSTDRNSGLADRLNGITRQRHRNHIEKCIQHLHRFLGRSVSDDLMDVLDDRFMDAKAEELRLASQELGKVTGVVDIEELLDIIFRDFCIGK